MYDTSTVSPDTNVLMVYARGDDENTYRTSSAYWSLLVQVPEAQKRRELYCALADEAALEPAKEYFEMGLPGMEEELARYQATKKILDRCPILRERLTEEKAVLYQQLWEANREIRTARKQLALCRKIQDHAPQMERDTQAAEGRLDSRNKNVSITKRPQAASNRPPGALRRTQTFERVHIQTLR